MSRSTSLWKTILTKTVKYISLTILSLLIIANLFILISGRTYLYKGIYNTYLQGRTGPSIFDKDVFFNATISKAPVASAWKKTTRALALLPNEIKEIEKLDISSFLVFHGDTLIFEKYWGNHQPTTVTNSFSAAKTFVGLLIGCALKDGSIKSLDEPVANYIPESLDAMFNVGPSHRSTFFIGGQTFGTFADVDELRKDEFRQLILKLKEVNTVAYLLINYI
jgi:hypothetical protein